MANPIPQAPYQYILQQGLIVPDTSDILAEVQNEYTNLFGADLDLDPSTPQGMLIAAETLARTGMVRSNADIANQINPNLAGGAFLDAICALTGLQRTAASPSVITGAALTGQPGAIINTGSQAKTTNGDIYSLVSTVILDGAGNGTGTFQSLEKGPIAAAANSLTTIVSNVLGWETVNNPTAGTIGQATQSDAQLRALRNQTLGKQGVAMPTAIMAAVRLVPGVVSLQFLENVAATTQTIDTITMVAHSVWVCVQGGTDADIGSALLASKSVGAAWNGLTTVNVTDPASGQVYAVKFDRPTGVPIWVKASIKTIAAVSDPVTSVQNAILAWAANEVVGIPGLLVGQNVSPFEVSAAIAEQVSGIYVQKLELSTDGSTWYTTELSMAINQLPTLTSGHITVLQV